MDLNTVTAVLQPKRRDDLPALVEGDAFLAGGTWLFSETQPGLRRLVDLTGFHWEPLVVTPAGLEIAATCTFARLEAFAPGDWPVHGLFRACCRALVGSFKVWNQATIGGNLCLALPASPMAALFAALDAICIVWAPDGGERRVAALDFVIGDRCNALRPGEILRAVHVPFRALRRRAAFRQISLSPLGRSGALLIGTRDRHAFSLTVSASTVRPVRLEFEEMPPAETLLDALEQRIPGALYHDDVHGRPDWRRHVTRLLACEIRNELAEGNAA